MAVGRWNVPVRELPPATMKRWQGTIAITGTKVIDDPVRMAAGTIIAPTAADVPLDEPPGVRSRSNGLRVGGAAPRPNSVVVVLPIMIAPPCFRA